MTLKVGAIRNLRTKRAEKNGAVVCRIIAFCAMHFYKQFATEKNITPVFSFLLPQLFPGGICLHLSMEWTPLPPTLTLARHVGTQFTCPGGTEGRVDLSCTVSQFCVFHPGLAIVESYPQPGYI